MGIAAAGPGASFGLLIMLVTPESVVGYWAQIWSGSDIFLRDYSYTESLQTIQRSGMCSPAYDNLDHKEPVN